MTGTIHDHFKNARNLGKTNNIKVAVDDMVIAIVYGTPGQENANYKRLNREHGYPIFIGAEFWHRLTGDENFYADFCTEVLNSFVDAAAEADVAGVLESTVNNLSKTAEVKALATLAKN